MKKYTIKELADLTKSEILGDANHIISGVNSLEEATILDASFLANEKYLDKMKKSKAGVICIDKKTVLTKNKNFIISENPSQTFQQILEIFISDHSSSFKNISKSADIHQSCKIGKNVTISPFAVIDKNVEIGDNTFIYPNCYIGYGVKIGKNCILHANVTIREGSILKNNIILQPGVVIGSCGFGFTLEKDGTYKKLKQIGIVEIEDDVEIGANTVIDRARINKTIIRKGTKIDNLVQIGHNVEIGKNNIIVAQSGFSGSSKTEENVVIGGQAGIAGHLQIKKFSQIAAKSGVSKTLPTGNYRGVPAIPIKEYNRNRIYLKNIEKYIKKLKELEKILQNSLDKK